MKITDAFWEKRNLGVDVTEIQCAASDSKEELKEALAGIKTPYSVCKVPGGAAGLLLCAQEQGYQVIEMSIGLEIGLRELTLPAVYRRFEQEIVVKEADREQRESILREIESGDIFETDRIALDPYFGKEMAGKRYANWSRDLLEQNGHVCVGYYKDTPAAFGVNIDKENAVCDAVLGGMLNHGGRAGLGFLSLFTNLYSARERGNVQVKTHVSSNNQAIIHLHLQFGYRINEMQYVRIRHQ